MNRDEYLAHWKDAIDNETFLTQKHDPSSVGSTYPGYRTVTVQSAPELKNLLESGDYKIRLFQNTKKPQSPDYVEIIPNDPSIVPGSGIQPHSTIPTITCDRFVAVSGVQQGWHLFAEESTKIQQKESNGDLIFRLEYL